MKHTPAPWNVKKFDSHAIWIMSGKWRKVAEVDGGGDENLLANAALIAAAPELLEVLENLVALTSNDFATEAEHWEYIMQVKSDARAAIAKARGK